MIHEFVQKLSDFTAHLRETSGGTLVEARVSDAERT